MLSHLDLFSGIGGFSLGLESAGVAKTVAFCDYEKWCQKVLKKHWPHVPIYGDVKELTHERLRADGIDTVDIITGGYPCQPFSVAGSQKGEQDPRHVWPEMFRLVQELRPVFVIGENVSGHIKLGLDTVLENLESEGYSTRTFSISAASIGANHKRERVWTLAYSNDKGLRARFGRSNYDYEKKGRVWSFDRGRSESDDEWSDFASTENEDLDVADSDKSNSRERSYDGDFGDEGGETSSTERESLQSENRQTHSNNLGSSDKIVADTTGKGLERQFRSKLQGTRKRFTHGSQTINEYVADTTGDRWNESKSNKISQSTIRESQEGGMLQSERTSNVSNSDSERRRLWETGGEDAKDVGQSPRGQETLGWWDVEPDVGRVAHGVPKRVDRLKGLGNAVVPQIPFLLGLTIREIIENE